MPIPFVAAVNRAVNATRRDPGAAGSPPRSTRSLSPRMRLIGWIVALVATFAMFMGGAGAVMLLAGHVTALAIGLTAGGVAGAVYLVLFLAMDSRTSRVSSPPPPRRRVTRAATGTCSFCGLSTSGERTLVRSPRATICHRCIEYARTITTPDDAS